MTNTYKITGDDAVRLARRENLTVCECDGIPFVAVVPTGWRDARGNHCDPGGRAVEGYFNSYTGEYYGPDDDGVEPCWSDASSSADAISAMVNDLVGAGIVWHGDSETAIRTLCEGKSWSTGIKDDGHIWDQAIWIAESHGFSADVDDSASSIDFVIRPL
jgi:hypothetical protein